MVVDVVTGSRNAGRIDPEDGRVRSGDGQVSEWVDEDSRRRDRVTADDRQLLPLRFTRFLP